MVPSTVNVFKFWLSGSGTLVPPNTTAITVEVVLAADILSLVTEVPVGPVGPVTPARPAIPVGPVGPVGPVSPVGPISPAIPVG
ncbi:MAG: hypothetical protein F8N38_13585, partial [Hungatella sp.]|nr:hypothetical protein [Hungatella sp.]